MREFTGRLTRLLLPALLPVWLGACSTPGEQADSALEPGTDSMGQVAGSAAAPTLSSGASSAGLSDAASMAPNSYTVSFTSHLDAGMYEQDVYVQSADDPDTVMRPKVGDQTAGSKLAMDVYAAAEAVSHDPFALSATSAGTYPKGEPLGFTLEEWLAPTGTGAYTTESGKAVLAVVFDGLVRDGVYTLWCSRLTKPPESMAEDFPCGAADGSQNAFTADANGMATFQLTMTPLAPSDERTTSMLSLAYHSDGESHGASAGDFGLNSHIQLLWMLPVGPAAP